MTGTEIVHFFHQKLQDFQHLEEIKFYTKRLNCNSLFTNEEKPMTNILLNKNATFNQSTRGFSVFKIIIKLDISVAPIQICCKYFTTVKELKRKSYEIKIQSAMFSP